MGDAVIDWLLDSDPSIRWQVMRDLLDAPESEWRAERAKVETRGWGARLLSYEDEDGQWAGGAFVPSDFDAREWQEVGQPWTATAFSLSQLREFGLDPVVGPGQTSRRIDRRQLALGSRRPAVSGRARSRSASTAGPLPTAPTSASTSRPSSTGWSASVSTTAAGTASGSTARFARRSPAPSTCWKGSWSTSEPPGHARIPRGAQSGEEYLLKRNLFRRLSTGEPADERFLSFLHPNRWRYDVLRALDYFRSAGTLTGAAPDPTARRSDRPRSLKALGRRHVAARLEPARPGLVRSRRRTGPTLSLGDAAGDARAQMGGAMTPPEEPLGAALRD